MPGLARQKVRLDSREASLGYPGFYSWFYTGFRRARCLAGMTANLK